MPRGLASSFAIGLMFSAAAYLGVRADNPGHTAHAAPAEGLLWPGQQPAQANRVVRITAERFAFTPSEITVPEGTTIEFHLKSDDTAHGFRILGQRIDVTIPKRGRGEATVTFTPPEPGRYVFECSRMCGAGHSFMRGVLRVRPGTEGAK